MINKHRFIICFIGILLMTINSIVLAEKANFANAEKFTRSKMYDMIGTTSVRANWLEKTNKFWYKYEKSNGLKYYMVDCDKKSKEKLFNTNEMVCKLTEITHKPFNPLKLELKKLEFLKKSETTLKFELDSLEFHYNRDTKYLFIHDTLDVDSLKKEREKEKWTHYCKDSSMIVYAKNHNLFLKKRGEDDSLDVQLTTDGERWYSYSYSSGDTTKDKKSWAIANWFKGRSDKLYFVRYDSREVDELFVINALKSPRPEIETYKYALPGEENVSVPEMCVMDIKTKKITKITSEKWKSQRLTKISTIEDSDDLYFIRMTRTWDSLDVCIADTKTGESRVIFSEVSKPYFSTDYMQLIILNKGKDLIWWSNRDGWGHFYRYDKNGNLLNRITKGYFTSGRVAQIDSTREILYFPTYGYNKKGNPYYTHYAKAKINGNDFKILNSEDATYSFSMSDKNDYFISTYSRIDLHPCSVLYDRKGNIIMDLETTDISRLKEAGWKNPEIFKVKATDGVTDNWGVMWKPFDFDSTKTYPVVTYVYPGPFNDAIPRYFSLGNTNTLAQLGFIVVSVSVRGSHPARTKYYHTFGYGNNRDYPLDDNKYAIEQLAARYPFMDINRVGMYGHSGGANMTAAAMFKYPDFYKVGVASSGNHDNNIYNIPWGEKHYGVKRVTKKVKVDKKKEDCKTPADSTDTINITETTDSTEVKTKTVVEFEAVYDTNPELAKNLKGHLLITTGDMDNNVHPANSIRLVDALIKANKRFDYMVFPGQRHGYGNYTKYFNKMIWYYFAEHLLDDYKTNVDF